MKVCNGNYGDTGWLGINLITSTVASGEIQNSVAKMNEYYLLNAEDDERQYTMCHELGHGFGLPHTDESFTNVDLGNCMDYTSTPANNMHPDESNYNRLATLYGTVDGRRRFTRAREGGAKKLSAMSKEAKELYAEAIEIFHREGATSFEYPSEWRVLQEHPRGGSYSRKLTEEYELTVHLLAAIPAN
jgi:hypothetical protein